MVLRTQWNLYEENVLNTPKSDSEAAGGYQALRDKYKNITKPLSIGISSLIYSAFYIQQAPKAIFTLDESRLVDSSLSPTLLVFKKSHGETWQLGSGSGCLCYALASLVRSVFSLVWCREFDEALVDVASIGDAFNMVFGALVVSLSL
jgi:hypothetical protein